MVSKMCEVVSLKCPGADLMESLASRNVAMPAHGAHSGALAQVGEKVRGFARQWWDLMQFGLSMQIAQALLRYVCQGAPQHALSAEPASTHDVIAFDAALQSAWSEELGLALTGESWKRAAMPLRDGGLAVGVAHDALAQAFFAFLFGSVNVFLSVAFHFRVPVLV